MARIYGEIQSSALMTFDKSFSRSNGQPLDSTEIFYSLVAAQDYAKTDVAYVGQKIVVVETKDDVTTVTHYGIESDNSLKELGAIPVGDGVTVEVVDGKIQLAALDGHTSGTYQPFLVDGKIEWREPSATTVEGLDSRLTSAEEDIEALEGIVGHAAAEGVEATGLVKAVADNADAIAAEETARKDADKDNADAIDAINTKIGEVDEGKTIVEMIADAKEEASYDDTDLVGRVSTIEGDYLKSTDKTELQESIDDVSAVANAAATKTALEAEIARAKAAEEKNASDIALILDNPDDEAINSIKEFTQYIADHGDVATGLQTQITKNKDDIAAEKTRAEEAEQSLSDDLTALARKIGESSVADQITAGIANKADQADLDDAVERIDANETAISGLKTLVGETKVSDQIASGIANKADQSALDDIALLVDKNKGDIANKVDKEDGKGLSSNDFTDTLLSKLDGIADGAQVNVIDSVDEAQFAIDENKKLTLLDVAMGKITGLQDALDGKANKGTTLAEYGITDTYTKTETEARIQEVLDGLSDTSETAASVAQALETYKTSNNQRVDTIEAKLEYIEEGAQVNKIESIKVGDTLLEIVDKAVVIPVGAGLKASDEITIAEDGALGIGEVNVNKLVQTDGEVLILNGGASAV